MEQEICFLTYMARSGSTLLSSELNQYKNIGVTLEDDIPDGVLYGNPVFLRDRKELTAFVESISDKPKWKAWKISSSELIHQLESFGKYPFELDQLYRAIFALYFTEKPPVIVHKKGRYYLKIKALRRYFPDAKFLHLIRDPRAVFNSQKKARDSRTGQPMAINILSFALNYRKMWRIASRKLNKPYFYLLRYEDFISNKEQELSKMISFLGVGPEKSTDKQYYNNIPQEQQHLHTNVDGELNPERIHAWKKELSAIEIAIIQKCLKNPMHRLGYDFSKDLILNTADIWRVKKYVFVFRLKSISSSLFPGLYQLLKKFVGK